MGFSKFFLKKIQEKQYEVNPYQQDLSNALDKIYKQWHPSFFKRVFHFLHKDNTKGIYVYGSIGSGKTHLMNFFFDFCKKPKKREHFKIFMLALHKRGYQKTIDLYKNISVLYLDELEIIDIADALIVKKLFETLNKKGIRILTTSNIPPEKLYQDGLHFERFSPFINYIQNHFYVFDLTHNTDYRSIGKKNIFKKTALLKNQKKSLTLVDTDLFYSQAPNHIIIHFSDIIQQRFGPIHFYELSKQCPYIEIINVPDFTKDNINQLRQLITLVDIYYDQNKIIFTNTKTLQYEKNITLPIKRMLSRLNEMNKNNSF